jgi:hypothetical protein
MANRYSKAVANCRVLTPEDDYATQQTPLDTKRREIADRELTNPDETPVRVRETARRRRQDSVKAV